VRGRLLEIDRRERARRRQSQAVALVPAREGLEIRRVARIELDRALKMLLRLRKLLRIGELAARVELCQALSR
jgi:hypothetical protein